MATRGIYYETYLRFYLGLKEGRKLGSADFYHWDGMNNSTPFDEIETVAAIIALEDFENGVARRERKNYRDRLHEFLGVDSHA